MSTSAPFGSQNGSTFPNFPKRKLETSFLQHESKIEDSLRFFPDKSKTRRSTMRPQATFSFFIFFTTFSFFTLFLLYDDDCREKIEDYLRFLTHAGETSFPIFA